MLAEICGKVRLMNISSSRSFPRVIFRRYKRNDESFLNWQGSHEQAVINESTSQASRIGGSLYSNERDTEDCDS